MNLTKAHVAVVPGLALLLFLASCASVRTPLPVDTIEDFVGDWINPGYGSLCQRLSVNPDGTYAAYQRWDDTIPKWSGELKLDERWTDAEGTIFCKVRWRNDPFPRGVYNEYSLVKFSRSGTVLELVSSYKDYPTEIDDKDSTYRIRIRQ